MSWLFRISLIWLTCLDLLATMRLFTRRFTASSRFAVSTGEELAHWVRAREAEHPALPQGQLRRGSGGRCIDGIGCMCTQMMSSLTQALLRSSVRMRPEACEGVAFRRPRQKGRSEESSEPGCVTSVATGRNASPHMQTELWQRRCQRHDNMAHSVIAVYNDAWLGEWHASIRRESF